MKRFSMPLACVAALVALSTGAAWSSEQPSDKDLQAAQEHERSVYLATHPVRVAVQAGRWKNLKAPNGMEDPIPALAAGEAAPSKPFVAKELATWIDGYVARIEAYHVEHDSPPEGFIDWLGANAELRRDFWLAISPQFDDAKAAMAVLDDLHRHDAEAVKRFAHLAIALAVVWDHPDAIDTSRCTGIFAIDDAQFSKVPDKIETFDFFVKKQAKQLCFKPTDLPWPVLVHLVDVDIAADEEAWATEHCQADKKDVGVTYLRPPYDEGKMHEGGTKLGSRPYTLSNILTYGGVCGDRAHFTSRIAKTFGIPSMKVCGASRYGGLHAWAGYLVSKGGRAVLEFTGRFNYDFYYTGEIFDPQTRTETLDRYVAMLYDGCSLSYLKYRESMALSRAGTKLETSDPQTAALFARQAIDRDVFNPNAWRLASRLTSNGTITAKDGGKLANRMLTDLAAHPDLTLECLGAFMDSIPKDQIDARQKLYEAACKLYATRPDLQIRLRMTQCAELTAAKREPKALEVALQTVVANAKEGGLILPLVSQVVETAKMFAATNKSFRLEVVKDALKKADADFPHNRGNTIAETYVAFQDIVGTL